MSDLDIYKYAMDLITDYEWSLRKGIITKDDMFNSIYDESYRLKLIIKRTLLKSELDNLIFKHDINKYDNMFLKDKIKKLVKDIWYE